jgi:hypothetical protein
VQWWAWLAIGLAGVAFVAATRRAIRRTMDADAKQEGAGTLLYYVFVDWWIDWL